MSRLLRTPSVNTSVSPVPSVVNVLCGLQNLWISEIDIIMLIK
jgi:hypothetical protein